MTDDLHTLTVSTARDLIRQKELSPLELTQACLRQIERMEPSLNAFITLAADPAVEQAKRAGATLVKTPPEELPPLFGIPFAAKDLYDTANLRTTGGAQFLADNVPSADAAVIARLRAAGMILLGKTNTHEIALGVTTVNPHYGATHNPWDLARIPGGSSGGSAAALAARMCPAALGTDTGGSIRIPSALCGTVGLKATYGRVSLRGVLPLSWNLDHAGPMTRSVRDAALMLQVMAGYDPQDPASVNAPLGDYLTDIEGGVRGWRVALAEGDFIRAADAEVLAAVREAARIFESLGANVETVETSWLHAAAQANGLMTQADAAAFHHERLTAHPEAFGEDVRRRLRQGAAFSSTDYSLARRTQTEMRRRLEHFFADYDLLLLPSAAVTAPPIEGPDAVAQAKLLTRFTAPFNLSGLPALSLPCGFDRRGLPIGLQIAAAPWQEAKILQAGHAYEAATAWHKRHPTPA
ncbi:MAG: amidase [Chloroflexi bacterium]|nr:amidase [Chloroflexota bacterium]